MNRLIAVNACLLLMSTFSVWLPAAEITSESLKSLLAETIQKHDHPGGMGAVVIHDGKIIAQATAGKRHHRRESLITDHDLFHLGSCTKAMTGTLVGLAVQRGNLKYDETLGELLSDWELHDDFKPVTIQQLLYHRSGLKANASLVDRFLNSSPKDDEGKIKQRNDILRPILKEAPEYSPDSKKVYSNLGYTLLGHILERKTGKSWETIMREQIFNPLDMKTADFGIVATGKDTRQPFGHVRNAMGTPAAIAGDNPPFMGPAGTIHMNLEDWSKFIIAHMSGSQNPLGLTEETLTTLHTPGPDSRYAAGWVVFFPQQPEPILFHNGSNTMWYCAVCMIPSRKEAVLITSNAFDQKPVHEVMMKLLSLPVELKP